MERGGGLIVTIRIKILERERKCFKFQTFRVVLFLFLVF